MVNWQVELLYLVHNLGWCFCCDIGCGVAYCPHCDGPYYKGKKVAVIGGGNSGVEAAIDLAGIVREVVVFEFMENLKADQVLVDKLKSLPNVSIVTNARTAEVLDDVGKLWPSLMKSAPQVK